MNLGDRRAPPKRRSTTTVQAVSQPKEKTLKRGGWGLERNERRRPRGGLGGVGSTNTHRKWSVGQSDGNLDDVRKRIAGYKKEGGVNTLLCWR